MNRLLSSLTIFTGTIVGSIFASLEPVQAFSFTTNVEGNAPKGDIFLKSVVLDTGEFVDQFAFVSGVRIVANDQYSGGNTGAASADRGDNTTTGVKSEAPNQTDLLINLSNNNLNNIIDTEAGGNFQIDLSFDNALDNLLIFERGRNSDLSFQALDQSGQLIGQRVNVKRKQWDAAGFSIDTMEIGSAQTVGSFGINIQKDFQVAQPIQQLRVFSESSFGGPDWKLVGTNAGRNAAPVPEPSAIVNLSVLAAGTLFLKHKASNSHSF